MTLALDVSVAVSGFGCATGVGPSPAARSSGRGGDDLTVDGCVESNPGPPPEEPLSRSTLDSLLLPLEGQEVTYVRRASPGKPWVQGSGHYLCQGYMLTASGGMVVFPGPCHEYLDVWASDGPCNEDADGEEPPEGPADQPTPPASHALPVDPGFDEGPEEPPCQPDVSLAAVAASVAVSLLSSSPGPGAKKAQCTCGRKAGVSGRHKSFCPRSAKYVGGGAQEPPRLPDHSQGACHTQGTQEDPEPDADPPPFPADLTFASLASIRLRTVARIPHSVAATVGAALENTLKRATGEEGHLRLYAFAPLVLRSCRRGGRKATAKELLRRTALWRKGRLDRLWDEARSSLGEGGRTGDHDQVRHRVSDESDRFRVGLGTDVEGIGDLDEATARRVDRLVRQRAYRKAISALSAAKVAPESEEVLQALRDKHPCADEPAVPDLGGEGPTVSKRAVQKALRGFPRGTAAGPSGLSAQHLIDLWVPGSPFPDALVAAVSRFANGKVTGEARRYFFGALLVPLEKKGGGVRPIAVGEVLRRLAAKVVAAQLKGEMAELLEGVGQFGVGVPSGLDTVAHTFRRVVSAFLRDAGDPPDAAKGLAKVDLVNAFNNADRSYILAAVARYAPKALPYAVAAYGGHTNLQFGGAALTSESGVQQGDPLGPLFFCLLLLVALRALAERFPDAAEGVEARGFYLDDGTVAGTWEAVGAWVDAFREVGRPMGLFLNPEKSEVIEVVGECQEPSLRGFARKSADDWELLGLPCGTPSSAKASVEKVLERAVRLSGAVASLPDPHVALSLHRACAGFPTVQSLMRGVGVVADFSVVDRATREALCRITGVNVTDKVWEQAVTPLRAGGLGLRDCAPYAAIACLAASVDAGRRSASVTNMALPTDPFCEVSLVCPRLAKYPTVLEEIKAAGQAGAEYKAHGQKRWSRAVTEDRAKALVEGAPEAVRARISSASARSSGSWLYGHPAADDDLWLDPPVFVVAVRLRLGLPVAPEPMKCHLCHAKEADQLGRHALVCMNAGLRTRAHNRVRDEVFKIASEALLEPVREPRPFTKDTGSRVDVAFERNGVIQLFDVAVTSPFKPGAAARAAEVPGGAATAYEKVKEKFYGPKILAEPRPKDFCLVPLVVDSLGAWGASARPAISHLAAAGASRAGVAPAVAIALAVHRLSFTVAREVAKVVLAVHGAKAVMHATSP